MNEFSASAKILDQSKLTCKQYVLLLLTADSGYHREDPVGQHGHERYTQQVALQLLAHITVLGRMLTVAIRNPPDLIILSTPNMSSLLTKASVNYFDLGLTLRNQNASMNLVQLINSLSILLTNHFSISTTSYHLTNPANPGSISTHPTLTLLVES